MTSNMVVTGAGGYLGGYLVQAAARRGYPVTGLVREPIPWLERQRQQVVVSLSDSDAVIHGADVAVHLAAPNETAFRSNPSGALQQTLDASRDFARACARAGVRRLFYVSTVHVYGSTLAPGALVTEESRADPVGDYGRSRLLAEEVILEEAGSVQVVILRLTNGIGPPPSPLVRRWTLVANDLCRQAVKQGRLTLAQPGQWRDFIPLDAVASLIFDASAPANEERIPAGIYNLSAARSIIILDLAKLIAGEARRMGITVTIDAPRAQVQAPYLIDNQKIRHTGLLPEDLSLAPSIRDTLGLCVAAAGDAPPSTLLGN